VNHFCGEIATSLQVSEFQDCLFLAYQADPGRQFEQIWQGWLNNPNIPAPDSGRDTLVGQPLVGEGPRPVKVAHRSPEGVARFQLPQFVTPHYGGDFFAPSTNGIKYLAVHNS
jgi:hypothetical protein